MGKINTPKYRLELHGFVNHTATPQAWRGRVPSIKQLERHVMAVVVSTMPGFVNEHIGNRFGIQIPSRALIVRQRDGKVMVEWRAPMFGLLPDPKDYPEVAKLSSLKTEVLPATN